MPKRVAETPASRQIDDYTGSGPFIFRKDEWKPGEQVVYVRNPRHVPRKEPASGATCFLAIYSRVLYGGRVSLAAGASVALLSVLAGTILGLAAGAARPGQHFSWRRDPATVQGYS